MEACAVSCTLWLHQAEAEPDPGIQRTFKEGPCATCKPSTPHGSGSLGSPAKPEAARPAALAESIEHDLYQAMSFPPQSARLPMTSKKNCEKNRHIRHWLNDVE